jgi:hypothetical protein
MLPSLHRLRNGIFGNSHTNGMVTATGKNVTVNCAMRQEILRNANFDFSF